MEGNENILKLPLLLEKAKTPLDLFGKLIIIKNLNYFKNKFLNFNKLEEELNSLTMEKGNTLFRGFLWEQINISNAELLPKGHKRIINEIEWQNYIKDLFPKTNNFIPSLDLHIVDDNENHSFVELKNLFRNNNDNIEYFYTSTIIKKIKQQLLFEKENHLKTYYFLNNTKTNLKMIIPMKDLLFLIEKNHNNISFNTIKKFLEKNYPKNILEKKEKKILKKDLKGFFEEGIQLFQKNIHEIELLIFLNTTSREDFFKEYDNNILNDISSKKELYNLFIQKNMNYINNDGNEDENKKIIINFFNNFIYEGLDFENKDALKLTFNNLKNALNNTFELEGRNKISLDKTNIEKYLRSKKVIDTMNKYGYSLNIIYNHGYENFLKKIVKNFSKKELLKEIGNKDSDYFRRIKPFLNKKIIEENISIN